MSSKDIRELAQNALKLAEQMKSRLVDSFGSVNLSRVSNLEKAAKTLVETGWLDNDEQNIKQAMDVLNNHEYALEMLCDLATKSASEMARLRDQLRQSGYDDRLQSKARFIEEYTKKAEDGSTDVRYVGDRIENEHDREFMRRVLALRDSLDAYRHGI